MNAGARTPRVAILDYGCGNLRSVVNAMREVGGEPFITPGPLVRATHLILPGQGAFCALPLSITDGLNSWRDLGKPMLGICLGMQLMCEGSEEARGVKGLGWLPTYCERLPFAALPHVGWSEVYQLGTFYFCHSYAAMRLTTDPITPFAGWKVHHSEGHFFAHWRQDKVWAVQFHPEKSGKAGLTFLREFLKL